LILSFCKRQFKLNIFLQRNLYIIN
jgi:hypothetical protein